MIERKPAEVDENAVEGKVKAVFDDIKTTLAIPTVGQVFRRLAVYPWFLQLAWRNLKPNCQIAYFQRTVDELLQSAVDALQVQQQPLSDVAPGTEDSAGFGKAVSTLLTVEVRLLLATAALRAGTNGQLPKMNLLSGDEKKPVRPKQSSRGGPCRTRRLEAHLDAKGAGRGDRRDA